MAEMLHIDIHLVSMAISVFCRLGFAKKRVTGRNLLKVLKVIFLGMENAKLHFTWAQVISIPTSPTMDEMVSSVSGDLGELSAALASPLGEGDDEDDEMSSSVSSLSLKDIVRHIALLSFIGIARCPNQHLMFLHLPVEQLLFSTLRWLLFL